MQTPRAARLAAAAAIAAAVILAAQARAAAEGEVKVAKSDKVGSYLTDEKGMALYIFKKDSKGKSACSGPCVQAWPIYHREKVAATGDVKASDFGTITREDGQKQTTYKGLPLYYWVKDAAPGDTTGHGVKDVWFLAQP